MRVAASILLFAACASAASLLDHPRAAAAQQSRFGSSVLAELESRLATGSPLDELKSIIDDIRDRLTKAKEEDERQQVADTAYCTTTNSSINARIADYENTITAELASIRAHNKTIDEMTIEIATQEENIRQDTIKIEAVDKRMADLTAQRELDNENFLNNTRDSNLCIEAINEIKDLPGFGFLTDDSRKTQRSEDGALSQTEYTQQATQDNKDLYQSGVQMASLLQKVADKITSERVTELVQIAALSSALLSGSDVAKLNELLDKLKDELKKYKVELADDEAASLAAYNTEMTDLKSQRKSYVAERDRHVEELAQAVTTKEVAEANRAVDYIELAAARTNLANAIEERRLLTLGCETRASNHEARKLEREDEQQTLNDIEQILTDKLAKHFDGSTGRTHLSDAIPTVA